MTTPQCTAPLEGDQFNLDNHSSFVLYVCAKEVVRCYTSALNKLDLTYTQYLAMLALWKDGDLSVKELGTRLSLDSGTLTPLLKKLEAKGYIERTRSTVDERRVTVSLTERGLALREAASDIRTSMSNRITLTEEEEAQLGALLAKVLDCLKSE